MVFVRKVLLWLHLVYEFVYRLLFTAQADTYLQKHLTDGHVTEQICLFEYLTVGCCSGVFFRLRMSKS